MKKLLFFIVLVFALSCEKETIQNESSKEWHEKDFTTYQPNEFLKEFAPELKKLDIQVDTCSEKWRRVENLIWDGGGSPLVLAIKDESIATQSGLYGYMERYKDVEVIVYEDIQWLDDWLNTYKPNTCPCDYFQLTGLDGFQGFMAWMEYDAEAQE